MELSCPFCDRGKIEVWYIPSYIKIRRISGSFGKGHAFSKSADIWIVKSGCPVCGKSPNEVERELKRKRII